VGVDEEGNRNVGLDDFDFIGREIPGLVTLLKYYIRAFYSATMAFFTGLIAFTI